MEKDSRNVIITYSISTFLEVVRGRQISQRRGPFVVLERWEKLLHVDYDWEDGNQFHSYISRFVQNGSDAFFII
jgi:hypothetical protein